MIKHQNLKKKKVVMTEVEKKEVKAIIGLGNPGVQYTNHRHNIGFRIIDAIAEDFSATWLPADKMLVTQISVQPKMEEGSEVFSLGREVYLIKPQTFMNSSGKVVPFLAKKGIKPEEILVIHDDLEKKFGNLIMRLGGSARGHNGLRSIIDVMGQDFWRFRFGIGRPDRKEEVPDYVLSNFTPEEEKHLPLLVEQAVALIKDFLS